MGKIIVEESEWEEVQKCDIELFSEMSVNYTSENEKEFFFKMKEKEYHEYAPSADLILSELHNADEIYIVRYFTSEYSVGRGRFGHRRLNVGYFDTLYDALEWDIYDLLDKHITLLEWLRAIDYKGVEYNHNYSLDYGRQS